MSRSLPPAVFAPILGLFGLGLAWRLVLPGVGELILGATSLIYLGCLALYLAKLARRPRLIGDELRVLPGRAGLAAATLSGLLLSSAVVAFSSAAATVLFWLCFTAHGLLAALVAWAILTGPAEMRRVTPVWHLSFVGFIVAAMAAVPLGYVDLARGVLWITVPIAATIYAISLWQGVRMPPPAPLRPVLAIHLAPLSLFGTVALLLGMPAAGAAFGLAASLCLLALILGAVWLTAGGFSPLWGAFTFPLAAYAGLMLRLGAEAPLAELIGLATLVTATGLIPWITARVLRMLLDGTLAAKTGAAIA